MTQLFSVSKAARLAGVSRSEIQKTIRLGTLATFEGKVHIEDLLRVFPRVNLDDDPVLEQIEQIKSKSHSKFSWQQPEPPSAEVLLRRLQTLSGMLLQTKSALDQNIDLLATVSAQLTEFCEDDSVDTTAKDKISAMLRGLTSKQTELNSGQYAMRGLETSGETSKAQLQHDKAVLFTRNLLLHIIAPSVQIIPAGHEFLIEGGDTVLDAAIRSGLSVNYGCNDAKCGECKARLISGQVLKTKTAGYKLSPHEKKMGYVLMCCNTAVTDLTLEAAEAQEPEDLPEQNLETSVSSMQALNDDTTLLHLRTSASQNLRFFAGQKATLSATNGSSVARSIISCPCDGQNLYFILQKLQDDTQSQNFLDSLHAKDKINISGPHGRFCLQQGSDNPSLFIASDHGFAPIKSLIEHAISIDRIKTFRLYRTGSKHIPDYYHNLCRSWEDAFENFHYGNLASNTDPQTVLDRISTDDLDLGGFDAYISGPEDFVDPIKSALIDLGLPADRLRFENV